MNIDVIHIYRKKESQNTSMYFDLKKSRAHHTTAAIQNACRRRNTGTSHSGKRWWQLKKTSEQ